MYQDYFGFSEMPFHVTPNPRFLFLSPTHEEALQHLRYGIEDKKGFIVLTGEVGCGKTTLHSGHKKTHGLHRGFLKSIEWGNS